VLPLNVPNFTMEPLLETGRVSGTSSFFDLVRPTPAGLALNPSPAREPDTRQYVVAARVRSTMPIVGDPGARPIDLITIGDVDFISDAFFDIRATAGPAARFDNITFFLNAIDLVAGDESFISLRDRRPQYRTLERLETQTRTFMERRAREEQQAQQEARTALEQARARMKKRVDDLNARTDLDVVAKQIMARNAEETENRQLRVLEGTISQARDARVRASRDEMESQIRRIRARIRLLAVLLPPLPVLLLGVFFFIRRGRRERDSAIAAGRLRAVA
jgi:ABC-2 type transport system permease protein